ncbi:uncharacterized protein LOC118275898 isoform X3 [Spodoptera frugiperda]|uniref:Uncharacterized protein LOC118275898 isoform X3 n=1 Tax=Spodoptera frugiperda TaxID=7108 RepID=A0A9R0DQF1_SPOFR|nr:uncharacterized protein LOC118275898 isoform X3 [Spodoptera frugiperda]
MHSVNVLTLVAVLTVGYIDSVGGQSLACPAVRTSSGWLDLFPLPCKKNSECQVMGNQHLCCKGFCTKGIKASGAIQQQRTTSTTTTTTTTTTPRPTTTTTEAPRPFLQLLPIQLPQATTQASAPVKTSNSITADVTYSHNSGSVYGYNVDYSSTGKTQKLVCPKPGQAPVVLFPILCEKNSQCRATSGPDQVCCEGRCVKGVPAPRPTSKPKSHQPLLGVIPRECPATPLGELLFEVQTCKTDADCWPRICCPDGTRSYCRTAKARLDLVPVANQIDGPVRMLEQYLQCTPPPQYDLFPQKCSSSVDCFPNLCCAEGGKKHCRPPQRSLIALLAGVGQRVGSTLVNFRQSQNPNN